MRQIKYYIIFLLFIFSSPSYGLDAFPGAEGYGKDTIGGRGGTVYIIDTLSDDPEDGVTFREACEANGARYVVFAVSGIIFLDDTLFIYNPNITIAGETSPGGILIAGAMVTFATSQVIVRHVRFRAGTENINYQTYTDGPDIGDRVYYTESQNTDYTNCPNVSYVDGEYIADGGYVISDYDNGYPCDLLTGSQTGTTLDNLNVVGQYYNAPQVVVSNVIFDHISASWGCDETFTLTGGVTNATVQWSIISEGLDRAGHETSDGEGHSKGLMLSGKPRGTHTISIHHNYIASNKDRSPMMFDPYDQADRCTYEGVNNVTYNWYKGFVPWVEELPHVNWINNYAKEGPDSYSGREVSIYIRSSLIGSEEPLLYATGNTGATFTPRSDPWNVQSGYYTTLQDSDWRQLTPWPGPPAITTTTMDASYAQTIVDGAGATVPVRDSVDARVCLDFKNGTGAIVKNVIYPDDYPTFETPAAPTDSNSNGIADTWEISTFGGLVSATDDADSDGYDNIEEYLHYLAGDSESETPAATVQCSGSFSGG